jgi:nicotinate phosphoribosyltransferase
MNLSLLADFYELSMMQGYFMSNMRQRAVFDMFFRRQPFSGGFCVFTGLADALSYLSTLSFTGEELSYLDSLGSFRRDFLDFLGVFRFRGDVYAIEEGEIVFPNEPLIRVHGSLLEAQLVESALLNTLNFQTLIATKAARICYAAQGNPVIEFGLRRAQGADGALSAARAAFIGGAEATSNTLAGKRYGIPVRGTMAHSWIMAFPNEREAFEKYAEIYPEGCTLLIDTFDTLGSGIDNAIVVGKKLLSTGRKGFGVRLDSGDLEYMANNVRKRLDAAGLNAAKIVVSNELDEHIIAQLVSRRAPIDVWGVGTRLVTGGGDPALTGVYKLSAKTSDNAAEASSPHPTWIPSIKLSNDPEKVTNPGVKQVWRFSSKEGGPLADLICLDDEVVTRGQPTMFHHPGDNSSFTLEKYAEVRPLLSPVMKDGKNLLPPAALPDVQSRVKENLRRLDDTYKRLINPRVYTVYLSTGLKKLKQSLIERTREKHNDRLG